MEKTKQPSGFLDEFEIPTYEQWLATVEQQLKGVPFEKKLITETLEGIKLQPLFRGDELAARQQGLSEPGQYPFTRGGRASGSVFRTWEVSQAMDYATPAQFNTIAVEDVQRGLTALTIRLDRAARKRLDPDRSISGEVGCDGLSIFQLGDLATAFSGLKLKELYLLIEAGQSALPFFSLLLAYLKQEAITAAEIRGHLVSDPLAEWAVSGRLESSLTNLYDELAVLITWANREMPAFRVLGIDGRCYREAGANAVQELAFSLASAVNSLREMLKRGLTIDEAASHIVISLTAGSEYFMEMAKFRCARQLWANIVRACGGREDSGRLVLAASSARYDKTLHDPYVNMLRATTEAFAGVIGGVDILSIAAFDALFGTPSHMGRRIARNVQIILREECHLDRVVDPAGGSWFIEHLTEEMGRKTWELFQRVEKSGGMEQALSDGWVQTEIEALDVRRRTLLAGRKKVTVGTNMFANLSETLPRHAFPDLAAVYQERLAEMQQHRLAGPGIPIAAIPKTWTPSEPGSVIALSATLHQSATQGATLGEIGQTLHSSQSPSATCRPLSLQRGSEAYEELRRRSEAFKRKTGEYPRVFLANLGPLKQHKARADFATGFLEPAGFAIIYSNGFAEVTEAVEAAIASESLWVVICSTDETYPALVPEFMRLIRQRKPEIKVALAGYPLDQLESLQAAGIDAFIHLKANNLQLLQRFQEMVGIHRSAE